MNHCDLAYQSLSHCGAVLKKTPDSFWNFTGKQPQGNTRHLQ